MSLRTWFRDWLNRPTPEERAAEDAVLSWGSALTAADLAQVPNAVDACMTAPLDPEEFEQALSEISRRAERAVLAPLSKRLSGDSTRPMSLGDENPLGSKGLSTGSTPRPWIARALAALRSRLNGRGGC